jgi:hypothetical protein
MELRVRSKDAAYLQNEFVLRFVKSSRKVWIPRLWLSFSSPYSVSARRWSGFALGRRGLGMATLRDC